ncbi:MAG: ABC transporter substrate-binding protein [Deltaproteobacteria bacterium]|jgi:iron complex transport system substrate-binding protein|nr:ABC transporter substrate-binding protein [Deltaproteobacteria bacterium]
MTNKTAFIFIILSFFSTFAFAGAFSYRNYDSSGGEVAVVVNKTPERVISTNGSTTELLLRLGLENVMIGSSWQDNPVAPDLKTAYDSVPVISDRYPSRELALSLEPDFIYGWGSAFNPQALGDVAYWHGLGVGTFVNRNSVLSPQRIRNFVLDIGEIGKIFGVSDRADAFLAQADARINKVREKVSAIETRKSVIIGEYLPNGIFLAYGGSSLADEMLAMAGGRNALPSGAILSPEGLATNDPEVIVMIHMLKTDSEVAAHLDELRKHPVLKNLKAVRDGRVYPLPMAEAHCAGVRIPDGVERLASHLYPELF